MGHCGAGVALRSLRPGRRQVTPPRLLMVTVPVVNSAAVWGHARGSVLSGPLRVLRGYGVSGTSNLNLRVPGLLPKPRRAQSTPFASSRSTGLGPAGRH